MTKAQASANATQAELEKTKQLKNEANERAKIRKQEAADAEKAYKELEQLYANKGWDKRKKQTDDSGKEVSLSAARAKKDSTAEASSAADAEASNLEETYRAQETALKKFNNTIASATGELAGLRGNLETVKSEVGELTKAFEAGSIEEQKKAFEALKNQATELGISLDGISSEGTAADVDELTKRIETLVSDGFEKAKMSAQNYSEEIRDTANVLDNMNKEVRQSADEFENLAE
jgi:hypothetical protein